jgi:hypothetical protein
VASRLIICVAPAWPSHTQRNRGEAREVWRGAFAQNLERVGDTHNHRLAVLGERRLQAHEERPVVIAERLDVEAAVRWQTGAHEQRAAVGLLGQRRSPEHRQPTLSFRELQ